MKDNTPIDSLIYRLSDFQLPSPGLLRAIRPLITTEHFQNKQAIITSGKRNNAVYFLFAGFAKEIAYDQDFERVSWFFQPGDFIYPYPGLFARIPAIRDVSFISGASVVAINFRDLIALRNNSAELAKLIDLIRDHCETERARHASQMFTMLAKDRFDSLLTEKPGIFRVAKHKDISSFLGIKTDSFSRLYKPR